jgi:hypothetical protein
LSFGTGSGRSSPRSSKGGSAQKKVRRRKQEYHTRKVGRFREEPAQQPGVDALRARTVLSLRRLGEQKFSPEGGYTLQNWLTNLNLLLDGFEEAVGPSNLPPEYLERRRFVVEDLLKPVDVSDLETEIKKCHDEQRETELRLMTEGAERESQRKKELESDEASIESLKQKRAAAAQELDEQKRELAEKRDSVRSASFFRKIFSSTTAASIAQTQRKVDALQGQLRDLDRKIGNLQRRREINLLKGSEAPDLREEQAMAALRSRIIGLEEEKLERLQISERRKAATDQIAEVIQSMTVPNELATAAAGDSGAARSEGGGGDEAQEPPAEV